MEHFFGGAMDGAWNVLFAPFAEFAFMRRALVATLALSLSAAPLGVFLTLRRMSLFGDALSHAILPGVAVGFMLFGLSLTAMVLGGVVSGMVVAGIAGFISRATTLREDASLAAVYLVALALGVTLISSHGTQLDLLHILFGSALGVDTPGLILVATVASSSLLILAAAYRGLVLESFDPVFLSATGRCGTRGGRNWMWQQGFLMLVVVNLVAGFQTLGTLMAVGLMMLPAVAARHWAREVGSMAYVASGIAMSASVAGLLLSFHADLPTGPAIVLMAGGAWAVSVLAGPVDGLLGRTLRRRHLTG